MALGDRRSENTTAGAPSGALGESNPGWVWRCDAAISHYNHEPPRVFFCSVVTNFTRPEAVLNRAGLCP